MSQLDEYIGIDVNADSIYIYLKKRYYKYPRLLSNFPIKGTKKYKDNDFIKKIAIYYLRDYPYIFDHLIITRFSNNKRKSTIVDIREQKKDDERQFSWSKYIS